MQIVLFGFLIVLPFSEIEDSSLLAISYQEQTSSACQL